MVVKGIVENIVFHNEENGFTVLRVSSGFELITLVGKFSAILQGQEITATGNFISDARWGQQFSVETYTTNEPTDEYGMIKYLSSGLITGVGPVTAQNIVEKFGASTFEVIEMNPLKLAEVKGVSLKKAAEIGQAFLELRKMQDVIVFLLKYNISNNMAIKIYNKYGEEAKIVLKNNPYKLIEDMARVGFKTADKIAQQMGVDPDSEYRLRAGIIYVLEQASDHDGNTYLPIENIYLELSKLLNIDISERLDKFNNVVNQLILESLIKKCVFNDVDCLMLVKYYNMELKISVKLLQLRDSGETFKIDLRKEIEIFEQQNKVSFHDDQKSAIELAVNNGVSVITGGPGTGKTTIIKCILQILNNKCGRIALLAPTGRASKRLSESCGEDASTIHRALMIDYTAKETSEDRAQFFYNENNKFPYDAVIVDEVSMVDAYLMLALLSALKGGTKLILVGDKNQLPSVGAGNILADILSSQIIPSCALTKIYRQSNDSLIITNAHAINNGEMPTTDNKSKDFFFETKHSPLEISKTILNLLVARVPKFLNISPLKIQILAPMRVGVCGVDNLNVLAQERLNPKTTAKKEFMLENCVFRVGDKVMQTSNNYTLVWKKPNKDGTWENGEAVFNGDIGFITDINYETNSVEVTFDDGRIADYGPEEAKELMLSYAITIHKSQGSEFDVVIVPIIAGSSNILTRNLLYTAVTRAKRMVILVGEKKNLMLMIKNNNSLGRFSALGIFLKKQAKIREEGYE